eukprot:gene7086-5021_t
MSDAAVHIISGTVAGMSSVVFDYPLDTLKTKMQAGVGAAEGGPPLRTHGPSPPHTAARVGRWPTQVLHRLTRRSVAGPKVPVAFTATRTATARSPYLECIRHAYACGGMRGLYRGASVPLLAQGAENAVIFSVYRGVLNRLEACDYFASSAAVAPWRSPAMLLASASAGAAVSFILTPVEYVKCNLQANRLCGRTCSVSPGALVQQTWRQRGVRGFLVGHKGTLLRAVPGNVAYFISFEQMKAWLGSRPGDWWRHMLAGGISGCAYWTICFPADVVKTRMQVDRAWRSMSFGSAARRHFAEAGVRGLYRGWGVTAVRSFLTSAVVFTVFEMCNEYHLASKRATAERSAAAQTLEETNWARALTPRAACDATDDLTGMIGLLAAYKVSPYSFIILYSHYILLTPLPPFVVLLPYPFNGPSMFLTSLEQTPSSAHASQYTFSEAHAIKNKKGNILSLQYLFLLFLLSANQYVWPGPDDLSLPCVFLLRSFPNTQIIQVQRGGVSCTSEKGPSQLDHFVFPLQTGASGDTRRMNDAKIDFLAGTLGGCAGTLVEHPFDTVKVLLQADTRNWYQSSALRCTASIYRRQGIRGLYAGLSARLCISGFEHALIFAAYGWMLTALGADMNRPGWRDVAAGGMFTGCLSGVVLTPFELVKCRMQAEADTAAARSLHHAALANQSMLSCSRDIWRRDGLVGFTRGGAATLLREIPGTAAWLAGYELMKRFFTSPVFASASGDGTPATAHPRMALWQTVLSGGVSGVLFWTIFFPADVVKTRIQVEAHGVSAGAGAHGIHRSPPFAQVFMQVFREGGIRALYRGWFFTMLRSFPSNAVIFTTFEGVRSFMHPSLCGGEASGSAPGPRTAAAPAAGLAFQPHILVSTTSLVPIQFQFLIHSFASRPGSHSTAMRWASADGIRIERQQQQQQVIIFVCSPALPATPATRILYFSPLPSFLLFQFMIRHRCHDHSPDPHVSSALLNPSPQHLTAIMQRPFNVPAPIHASNRRALGRRIKRGLEGLHDLDARRPSPAAAASPPPTKQRRVESPVRSPSGTEEDEDGDDAGSSSREDVLPHIFAADWSDWRAAKRAVFRPGSSAGDKRCFLSLCELWRARARSDRVLPPYVEATELLVGPMAMDQSNEQPTGLLAQSYGAALSRVVHVLAGSFARDGGLDTYRKRAHEMGLPEEAVEVRQRVAHGALPHITELRWVSSLVLQYLYQTFWVVQESEVQRMEQLEAAGSRRHRARDAAAKPSLETAAGPAVSEGPGCAEEEGEFSIEAMKALLESAGDERTSRRPAGEKQGAASPAEPSTHPQATSSPASKEPTKTTPNAEYPLLLCAGWKLSFFGVHRILLPSLGSSLRVHSSSLPHGIAFPLTFLHVSSNYSFSSFFYKLLSHQRITCETKPSLLISTSTASASLMSHAHLDFVSQAPGHCITSTAFDVDGQLLAVCATSGEILGFDPSNRQFKSLYATDSSPVGMAVDHSSNDVFVTNHSEQCVMRGKINPASPSLILLPYLSRFEGRSFLGPTGAAISPVDGELFFTDGGCEGDSSVINPSGAVFRTVQNRSQLVPLCTHGLQRPSALAFGADGCLFVCEQSANRLLRFVPRGSYYSSGIFAHFSGSLGPSSIAVSNLTQRIFVALYEPSNAAGAEPAGRIVVLNMKGEIQEEIETPGGSQLTALSIDPGERYLYAIHADEERCSSSVFCFSLAFPIQGQRNAYRNPRVGLKPRGTNSWATGKVSHSRISLDWPIEYTGNRNVATGNFEGYDGTAWREVEEELATFPCRRPGAGGVEGQIKIRANTVDASVRTAVNVLRMGPLLRIPMTYVSALFFLLFFFSFFLVHHFIHVELNQSEHEPSLIRVHTGLLAGEEEPQPSQWLKSTVDRHPEGPPRRRMRYDASPSYAPSYRRGRGGFVADEGPHSALQDTSGTGSGAAKAIPGYCVTPHVAAQPQVAQHGGLTVHSGTTSDQGGTVLFYSSVQKRGGAFTTCDKETHRQLQHRLRRQNGEPGPSPRLREASALQAAAAEAREAKVLQDDQSGTREPWLWAAAVAPSTALTPQEWRSKFQLGAPAVHFTRRHLWLSFAPEGSGIGGREITLAPASRCMKSLSLEYNLCSSLINKKDYCSTNLIHTSFIRNSASEHLLHRFRSNFSRAWPTAPKVLDLDTMPCKGKRPRSASSRAPVSDKIGAGAPIVIDGCTDRWTNVGLALRSVLPLDERCPLVMLGGDAPRSLEVARFLPNLLFCFRPAPVEWNNCFSDEIRSVQLEDRQMHAKLVSRMSDSPVAPLDPFQEEDPDEDETDSVLEVARMMQHTSTTPAATPRSESDLESRVTAMEDVLREIQQYMRRTTATVAAPIVAETSVAPTTTAGTSFFCPSGTFPVVDIAAWKTQLEPLNRFEKLVTLQKGLNPLNIGADSPGLTNEFDSLFNLVETAASCNWIELGLPQFMSPRVSGGDAVSVLAYAFPIFVVWQPPPTFGSTTVTTPSAPDLKERETSQACSGGGKPF